MAGESRSYGLMNFLAWLIPGTSVVAAVIASITNSEFRPKLAFDGTIILIVTWVATWLLFKIVQLRPAENARIKSPGKKAHAFYIGAILALWMPWLFLPLQAQKVEIILDVSQRMGQEFNPPGTTKFDAAREGVFQVLGYLENQNVKVALRLVTSSEIEQCMIAPETSLVVDFTKDLDKIRNYVNRIQVSPSNKAPVVDAIDFSIAHYRGQKRFDKGFYIYSFLGGDDTCGDKISVYLDLPTVKENHVYTDLYMIIMLGTDEEEALKDLPNAKLSYARNAIQVQQIVQKNNQHIAIPTPTPTIQASIIGFRSETTISPTQSADLSAQEIPVTGPIAAIPSTLRSESVVTKGATRTLTATIIPSLTVTLTRTPTPTSSSTSTKTQTATPSHTQPPNTETLQATESPEEISVCPNSNRIPITGEAHPGSITIDYPANCSTGYTPETKIEMGGSYSGVLSDIVIWVLVYPPNELYYPQSPSACATPTAPPPNRDVIAETWSVDLYLGSQSNPFSEWFDVVVVLTDQEASNFLSNWLYTACQVTPPAVPEFTGISPATLLQMNIIEKSVIQIRTR